jgi:tetratricopeptide (TPR) repeat protein
MEDNLQFNRLPKKNPNYGIIILIVTVILTVIWSITYLSTSTSEKEVKVNYSKEDFEKFAQEMVQSISDEDPTFINEAFDVNYLVERALIGIRYHKTTKKEIMAYASKKFRPGDEMIASIREGAILYTGELFWEDDVYYIILGSYHNNDVNYVEFELRNINNEIRIADTYNLKLGKNTSGLLREMNMMQYDYNTQGQRDFSMDKAFAGGMNKMKIIRAYMAENDPDNAMYSFKEIRKDIKSTRIFQQLRIEISALMGDSAFAQAIDQYLELYPGDECYTSCMLLKKGIATGNSDLILTHVSELRNCVGDDPALFISEGMAHHQKKDYNKALEIYTKATTALPQSVGAQWQKTICHLTLEDDNGSIASMNSLMANHEVNLSLIDKLVQQFPKFEKSEAYNNWKKTKQL